MKRILTLAVAILWAGFFIGTAQAQVQNWYPANQATVLWDPVTTLDGGGPIPAGNIIKYHLWAGIASDPAKANPIDLGSTDQTQMTLTFTTEGRYFVGVQTERWIAGALESTSVIGWTDDPSIVADGKTFGIKYYLPPGVAHGIRK